MAVDQELIRRGEILRAFKDTEAGKLILAHIQTEKEALFNKWMEKDGKLIGGAAAKLTGTMEGLNLVLDFVDSAVRYADQEHKKAEKISAQNPA